MFTSGSAILPIDIFHKLAVTWIGKNVMKLLPFLQIRRGDSRRRWPSWSGKEMIPR
jgi:hypothetical protein